MYVFLKQEDLVSKQYKKLKGEDKNLLLAAAHIDDAKTGRYVWSSIR